MGESGQATHSESERLKALDAYDILDTPREEAFDRITRMVTRLLGVPISTLTLIDGHRQWFKSREGIASCESDRTAALCDHAIRQTEPLVVPDTHLDPRFVDYPPVVGEPFIRFYAGVPLRAPGGHAVGTLCAIDTRPRDFPAADLASLCDLARMVENELELRRLATVDSLTGAMSRHAFRAEATRAIALANRHHFPLSCLMIDLDHFKTVNDRFGHAVGDAVLKETIRVCGEHLRQSDLIGRLGGEEFGVILPHTDDRGAVASAEKLRSAIAELRVATGGEPISVTASIGIATLREESVDLDALLQRADVALYDAKRLGRARCVQWRRPHGERTVSTQRRVLKAGRITFNAGRSAIDCTVRGLSDSEASLHVMSTAGVPDSFKLQIEADGFSRLCHVSARRDQRIDVAFEQPQRAAA